MYKRKAKMQIINEFCHSKRNMVSEKNFSRRYSAEDRHTYLCGLLMSYPRSLYLYPKHILQLPEMFLMVLTGIWCGRREFLTFKNTVYLFRNENEVCQVKHD